jgi:hypothetical protein
MVVTVVSTTLYAVVEPKFGRLEPTLPTVVRLRCIVSHSRYSSSTVVDNHIERLRRRSAWQWTVSNAHRLCTSFVDGQPKCQDTESLKSLKDPIYVHSVQKFHVRILEGVMWAVGNSLPIGVVSYLTHWPVRKLPIEDRQRWRIIDNPLWISTQILLCEFKSHSLWRTIFIIASKHLCSYCG